MLSPLGRESAEDFLFVKVLVPEFSMSRTEKLPVDISIRELVSRIGVQLSKKGLKTDDVINFQIYIQSASGERSSQPMEKRKNLKDYVAQIPSRGGALVFCRREKSVEALVSEQRGKTMEARQERERGLSVLGDDNDTVKFLLKGRKTRSEVVAEIFSTEETYVKDLNDVCDAFVRPLRHRMEKAKCGEDIPLGQELPENIVVFFYRFQAMAKLHTELLGELKRIANTPSSAQKIGDVFLKLSPYFEMYGSYCFYYERNIADLDSLRPKYAWLNKFISSVETDQRLQGLSVGSPWIKPVQRIPRYRLLFEQLLKYTPETHSDYEVIKKCLSQVTTIAADIDNYKGCEFNLLDLASRLEDYTGPPLVNKSRQVLKQGNLKKISSRATQERKFFLLTDMLIYCEPCKSPPYKCRGWIPLQAGMWLKDLSQEPKCKVKHAFQLVAERKTYTLYASSQYDMAEWSKAINKVLKEQSQAHPDVPLFAEQFTKRSKMWSLINRKSASTGGSEENLISPSLSRRHSKGAPSSPMLLRRIPSTNKKDRRSLSDSPTATHPRLKKCESADGAQLQHRNTSTHEKSSSWISTDRPASPSTSGLLRSLDRSATSPTLHDEEKTQ